MNCMRCGKETEGKAVFCPECLEDMERHPVKPGTLIHIPARQEPDARKPAKKRRELTLEEQLSYAHTMIQILLVTVLGLLGALIITGLLFFYSISQPQDLPEETSPITGRNYTIITPAEGD